MPAEIYPDFSECSTCDRVRPLTIIAVSNQKGGVGKTTTAISLGAALVEQGEHVLIVDLDPQANATSGLGVSKAPPNPIYGLILKEQPLDDSIVPTSVPGLDLVRSGHGGGRSGARVGDGPRVPAPAGPALVTVLRHRAHRLSPVPWTAHDQR